MPSQNMLPKGKRRRTVRPEYVATRGIEPEALHIPHAAFQAVSSPNLRTFVADPTAASLRLDQYLARAVPDLSRARIQLLIQSGQVKVDGSLPKAKSRLHGNERIDILGEPHPAPLHATPENIPLTIVYEDQYLAAIDKPAGMTVHAGAGQSDDARNRGTLVNALLFHFNHTLSTAAGDLRPGIVHRLDKLTSGLILVAKDDLTHRKLSAQFAAREVHKTYLALAHGHLSKDTTVTLPIARDVVRRTRMTTRRSAESSGARSAVTHLHILERLTTPHGPFTLLEVTIETGRTHQIRVHLAALHHPIAGDTLYGAPRITAGRDLHRNFLHAFRLVLQHPRTAQPLALQAPLPPQLTDLLTQLRTETLPTPSNPQTPTPRTK